MENAESVFVYNGKSRCFFNTLKENLENCNEFKISVAFITYGGLQVLLDTLKELEAHNIPGEILTTTYQYMTTPNVLEKLASFKNIKLKIYIPPTKDDGFHAKGYLFRENKENQNQWTVIIGSSNITGRALKTNVEWNLLRSEITEDNDEPGKFTKSVLEEFESLWKSPWSKDYSDEFIISYRDYLTKFKKRQRENREEFSFIEEKKIEPNEMQQEAIVKLDKLRKVGEKRALAIAATGSVKTYMSVFDALQVKPNRMLFVVHQEIILKKAKESFDSICTFTEDNYNSGFFTGKIKECDKKYTFATVETLSRHYNEFEPNYFDYIVIDEAHHASSPSYKKIIDYFKPAFLLGLTATPERSDDGDVYELFDNNVAIEIRLRQAMEYNLVCPFHYFGITDAEGIDYSKIKGEPGTQEYIEEVNNMLMASYRVDYIIEKMNFYGNDGNKRKALGFCQSKKHAQYMADEFNKRGIPSIALYSGDSDSKDIRNKTIERLESDNNDLQVIFTVDLFNEGVDIPSVNLVLMLRPTESSIIFIQQLGRGLRKLPDKEFVTVLDFIGNYNKSFLMAIALNGKQNFDKDNLKTEVQNDFADLANGTYIQMDKITKEQILRQLDNENFKSMKYLKEAYLSFRHICGNKPPMLVDYLTHDGSIDPFNFTKGLHKTYVEFVFYMEKDNHPEMFDFLNNEAIIQFIRFLSSLAPAKRIEEWVIILNLLDKKEANLESLKNDLKKYLDNVRDETVEHACKVLSGNYLDSSEQKRYGLGLCNFENNIIKINPKLISVIEQNNNAKEWIYDLVNYSIHRYENEFGSEDYGMPFLKLYHDYSMREVALLCNYEKKHSSFRGSGLITSDKPNYYLFVNLHKDADVKESINYKDKFITQNAFIWQSPNSTKQNSDLGKDLIYNSERNINLHLFVRKFEEVDGVVQNFKYFGKVFTHPESAEGDKPITMTFALENPVPDELYLDFITRTDNLGKEVSK